MAWRQCPKRLWLEVHHPELRQVSDANEATFMSGYAVGNLAHQLYDPDGRGTVLDIQQLGLPALCDKTQLLLAKRKPIFEAGFRIPGALSLADVLLPVGRGAKSAWRMVEVKSSTQVKDYHIEDSAIQYYIATQSKLKLDSLAVAVVDTGFVYPGQNRYAGLLIERDVTEQVVALQSEVPQWIAQAQKTVTTSKVPAITTGKHCNDPFVCSFAAHCQAQEPQVQYPVAWLPKVQTKALKAHNARPEVRTLRDVPDNLLNPLQLRVKTHTLKEKIYLDRTGAQKDMAAWKSPLYFLDFETITFAVPIWKRTRPYQQIPFQFSLHRIDAKGKTSHQEFLDTNGKDPSQACTLALIEHCGRKGAIVTYNAAFEKSCIRSLAERFPKHADALLAIHDRIVDLKPVVSEHYYHPAQQGSWSIKAVLPTMVPELSYQSLDTVQNGGGAQQAYLKAIEKDTPVEERDCIRNRLLAYCKLDTFAMVRIWQTFVQDK